MGTGIGTNCERCGEQLNDDDGYHRKSYDIDYDLCNKCYHIFMFDSELKREDK